MIKINSTEIKKNLVVKSGSTTSNNPVVEVNGTQVWPVDVPDLIAARYFPAISSSYQTIVSYVPYATYRSFKVDREGYLFSIGNSASSYNYPTNNYFYVYPNTTYKLYNQEFNLGSGTGSHKDVFFVGDSWLDTSDGNLWTKILGGTVPAVIYRTGPSTVPEQSSIFSFSLNLDVYFVD